jgi:hypothetical protein
VCRHARESAICHFLRVLRNATRGPSFCGLINRVMFFNFAQMVKNEKHGRWPYRDQRLLLELAAKSSSLEQAARRLERTPFSVQRMADKLGASFRAPKRKSRRA